jgi:hypothetical protein
MHSPLPPPPHTPRQHDDERARQGFAYMYICLYIYICISYNNMYNSIHPLPPPPPTHRQDDDERARRIFAGTQFTCFTGTKVQILTLEHSAAGVRPPLRMRLERVANQRRGTQFLYALPQYIYWRKRRCAARRVEVLISDNLIHTRTHTHTCTHTYI